jgi:Lon protease-like protein
MGERPLGLSSEQVRALVAQAAGALKVFPLHDVVVLPGTPTPLHVFEPRYRALIADALASDRLLAVAALRNPEGAALARAPVLAVAGVGFIEEEERLHEGRYNITLRGVARVRLLEELDRGKPYREFHAQLLDDVYPAGGPAALASQVEALEQCVYELAAHLPPESGAPQLAEAAARMRAPARLADLVAAAVVSEPATRQSVLEEVDVLRRLELVTSEVAGVILVLSQGKAPRA